MGTYRVTFTFTFYLFDLRKRIINVRVSELSSCVQALNKPLSGPYTSHGWVSTCPSTAQRAFVICSRVPLTLVRSSLTVYDGQVYFLWNILATSKWGDMTPKWGSLRLTTSEDMERNTNHWYLAWNMLHDYLSLYHIILSNRLFIAFKIY
jgi:hypothetical protein